MATRVTRQTLRRRVRTRQILAAIERRAGRPLIIEAIDGQSYYDSEFFCIKVGVWGPLRRQLLRTWPNHLLFHELGHAVADVFGDRFDRAAFKQIFRGTMDRNYVDTLPGRFIATKGWQRPAVSALGCTHPEEAWAEAFSFVLARLEDRDEPAEVIDQLAYADWVIDNLIAGRRRWGRYRAPTVEVGCCECGADFDLLHRQKSRSRGIDVECPECGADVTLTT